MMTFDPIRNTKAKTALIIDDEVDFCLLMQFYLNKKGIKTEYALTLREAVVSILSNRPDLILADKDIHPHLETTLHGIIDDTDDYDPEVYI